MTRKRIGLIISGVCLAVALLWWAEIGYRIWLFFTDYKKELFSNHVDDGYFTFVHVVLGCFLLAGTIATVLLSKDRKAHAIAALVPTGLGVLAWVAVFIMHRTGVLIGYMEWIGRMKGIQP